MASVGWAVALLLAMSVTTSMAQSSTAGGYTGSSKTLSIIIQLVSAYCTFYERLLLIRRFDMCSNQLWGSRYMPK
jgi:hypothetical protein